MNQTETMPIGVGTFSPTAVLVTSAVTVTKANKQRQRKRVKAMTHAQFLKFAATHSPPASWYDEPNHVDSSK